MAIEFTCTSCSKLVRTPDSASGKKGRCPYCQAVVQIPLAESPAPAAAPQPQSKTASAAAGGQITFACAACGKATRAPAAMAGKRGRCPSCSAVVNIPAADATEPARSAKAPRQAASAPSLQAVGSGGGLTPLGPTAGLTPLGSPPSAPFGGLQPLGGPGLSPLGAAPAQDPFAGLQPVGQPSPFASASSNPFGDMAIGGPAVPNPLGSATLPSKNPYSSPLSSSYSPQIDDPRRRRGLPWQREQDFESFSATVKEVLFSFPSAFQTMRVSGGVGSALGFVVGANVAAFLIAMLLQFMLNLVLGAFVALAGDGGAEAFGALLIGGLIGLVFGMLVGSILVAVIALVQSFVYSGVVHLCLLIAGGANRGFETTYQVVAYSSGSIAMLAAIPFVGLIGIILYPVILIFGLMHSHATSGLRATVAVLLPFLACMGMIVLLVMTIILPLVMQR